MTDKKKVPKTYARVKTLFVENMAREMGIDPFEILLLYAAGDWKKLGYKSETVIKQYGESVQEEYTISPELRMSAAGKCCEYLYPKRKATEISISDETVTNITRTILTRKV